MAAKRAGRGRGRRVTARRAHINDLPDEIFSKIAAHLNIIDRMRLTRVSKSWREKIYTSQLWAITYLSQWGTGLYSTVRVRNPVLGERMRPGRKFYRVWLNPNPILELTESWDSMKGVSFRKLVYEYRATTKFVCNIMPHVGHTIRKLSLRGSSVLSDYMLNLIMLLCPNITHLNVSYTGISGTAFYGLSEFDACTQLKYLDFTSCKYLTDQSIRNLALCWRDHLQLQRAEDGRRMELIDVSISKSNVNDADMCVTSDDDWSFDPIINAPVEVNFDYLSFDEEKKAPGIELAVFMGKRELAGLEYLDFSACSRLTDHSLLHLSVPEPVLERLQYLNVTGNKNFTSQGLINLVTVCPSLKRDGLLYCNKLKDGPYKALANDCNNLPCIIGPCAIHGE